MSRFLACATFAFVVGLTASSLANGEATQTPSFTTTPSPPVAGQPFTVDAYFSGGGGTPLVAFHYDSTFQSEAVISISGSPSYPLEFGQVQFLVPSTAAGSYSLDITNDAFDPRPLYASFQLTIVPVDDRIFADGFE